MTARITAGAVLVCVLTHGALALDPRKSLTQYSRTVWSQQHGLPQDTIRAIAQTTDGYLWLGTDEGLARFDGYEFVVFNKDNGDLPGNSITALAAARDGSLWIGTSNGLTCYRDKRFRTYTTKQGLPDNAITALVEDRAGTLWIVAGVYLSRYQAGKFTNLAPGPDLPVTALRAIREDWHGELWIGGFGGVGKLVGGRFLPVVDAIAEAHGVSRTVVALAWLLKHPAKIQPIIGSTNPDHIREAAKATDLELTREEWYRLLLAARGEPVP